MLTLQTILIIDENVNVLRTLRLILKLSGYRVLGAGTHHEAAKQFASNVMDLVIVDHGLPGIGRPALAEKFKDIKQASWALIMTGNAELLWKPGAVNVLLPMPSSVSNLPAEIEGLLTRAA